MELGGDEKRIQALFFELSVQDQQHAPRFEKLWREAVPAEQAPRFTRSLVVIAATLIVAVAVLFVAWSRKRSTEQNVKNVAPQTVASPLAPYVPQQPDKVAFVHRGTRSHSSSRRTLARQRQPEPALEQQAALLANWKSPTEKFMTSPTRSVFNSLPQLNESVKDLQSFLSKNNESMKESNQ